MSEKKIRSDVEMPNLDKHRGEIPESYRTRSKLPFYITLASSAVVVVIIILLFNVTKEEIIASIPVLEKAWIISRVEGETVANNEPKTVLDGRGVMLYFIAYGKDETVGESFYYIDVPGDVLPQVVIDGEEIPAGQLRIFEFPETIPVVHWSKMEVSSRYYYRRNLQDERTDVTWTTSRTHRMGNMMWAIADTRADILDSHYDHVGTMFYTAELVVSQKNRSGNLGRISNYDELGNESGKLPVEAHRITTVPETRIGLDAAYRAYFNSISFEDWNGLHDPAELTDSFQGGSSRTIMAGTLKLMGYDVELSDTEFLGEHADMLFENVTLDDFLFFRPAGKADGVIPYGENGVVNGDVLTCGDRYMVIVENTPAINEPAGGVFTGDDVILDAWDNMVQPRFANILEEMDAPISIWRLKPLSK